MASWSMMNRLFPFHCKTHFSSLFVKQEALTLRQISQTFQINIKGLCWGGETPGTQPTAICLLVTQMSGSKQNSMMMKSFIRSNTNKTANYSEILLQKLQHKTCRQKRSKYTNIVHGLNRNNCVLYLYHLHAHRTSWHRWSYNRIEVGHSQCVNINAQVLLLRVISRACGLEQSMLKAEQRRSARTLRLFLFSWWCELGFSVVWSLPRTHTQTHTQRVTA